MAITLQRPIPRTLEGALDPEWLADILGGISNGAKVAKVEIVDPLQVNQLVKSTIVRFRADFADGKSANLVLKGYLDRDEIKGSPSAMRESRFYSDIAPHLSIQRPEAVALPLDREGSFGIVYMRDMIEPDQGVHFCSALEPFDADKTSKTLDELAHLHVAHLKLPIEKFDWLSRQIVWVSDLMKPEFVQTLMEDQRSIGMPTIAKDAKLLVDALKVLAKIDSEKPVQLIHGDCHAGNSFMTKAGAGLIDFEVLQQGSWSLDVAYHIAATLPVDVAEREERNLLRHYLETIRSYGGTVPDDEGAWLQYRMSAVYGFFMWAITRTVKREIIDVFFNRLGHSVARHESYKLLGF